MILISMLLALLAGHAGAAIFPTPTPASSGGAREVVLQPVTAYLPDASFASIIRTPRTNITDLTGAFTQAVDQSMFWTFGVPSNYSGNVTVTLYWSSTLADGTKNCVWQVGSRSVADGSTWDSTITLTSVVDANKGTANQINEASLTLTTPWTAGQLAQVQVKRDAGAPSTDDLAAVASLYNVKLAW